jgi:hypothetical protein
MARHVVLRIAPALLLMGLLLVTTCLASCDGRSEADPPGSGIAWQSTIEGLPVPSTAQPQEAVKDAPDAKVRRFVDPQHDATAVAAAYAARLPVGSPWDGWQACGANPNVTVSPPGAARFERRWQADDGRQLLLVSSRDEQGRTRIDIVELAAVDGEAAVCVQH